MGLDDEERERKREGPLRSVLGLYKTWNFSFLLNKQNERNASTPIASDSVSCVLNQGPFL